MRSIAIGRKNWLFAGSRAGGERAAAIYTVIETCKLNGIEPQAYIADFIARIAGDWPAARWDELMPWNWPRRSPRPHRQCRVSPHFPSFILRLKELSDHRLEYAPSPFGRRSLVALLSRTSGSQQEWQFLSDASRSG